MMRHVRLVLLLAGWKLRTLARMPGILAVIFLPGMVLYAVFTMVLPTGNAGGGGLPQMRVALVDEDDSPASRSLVDALEKMSVHIRRELREGDALTRETAGWLVEKGHVSAALVIPAGYGANQFALDVGGARVELIIDETQPMAGDIIGGMLQMAAGMALFDMFDDAIAKLTGQHWLGKPGKSRTTVENPLASAGATAESSAKPASLLRVDKVGVSAEHGDALPPPSLLYLAGLVPMFLLFNASGAASGMLEELKLGMTRRILAAPVDAGHYLCGHLLMSLVLSLLQVSSIYALAWVLFKAPIFQFAGGLAAVTIATAFATVGFGVLMASVARTAEQLNSIGTVVILGMSAVGGSMFPRIFMPEWIKPAGLFTINAWAYDGLIDVIRGKGIAGAAVEIAVLVCVGVACAMIGSMLLSRRLRTAPASG